MIYLALVILISSSIFITFKLFKRYNINNFQAITVNYIVASALGVFICGYQFQADEIIEKAWFSYSCEAEKL
jgi:type IV secretory pathway TrbL component